MAKNVTFTDQDEKLIEQIKNILTELKVGFTVKRAEGLKKTPVGL